MPHLSIVAVFIVSSYLLLLGEIYLLFKAAIILIPLFIISIVLIWNKKTIWDTPLSSAENLSFSLPYGRLCRIYLLGFIITYIWSVWSQEFNGLFLILIVILYGITIVQIFSKHSTSKAILIELTMTTLLFSYVQVFGFSLSFPSIDVFAHSHLIETMLISGNTVSADIWGAYVFFNLYHIYIASGFLLSGLGVYVAAYLFHIPFTIIGSFFVYCIAKSLTKSQRVSELSAFSYLMIPAVLEFAVCIMPSVFAVIAFLIILYIFIIDEGHMQPAPRLFLTGFFTFYMTLVHHMTMPLAFFFMAVIIFSAVFYKHNFSKIQKGIVVLFYTVPILYIMYTYLSSLLSALTIRLFSPSEAGMQKTLVSFVETFDITFWVNVSVSAIMLVLLYFMIYYFSRNTDEGNYSLLILLPTIVVFLIFFLPGIVDISTQILHMFQVIRWRFILAPIFAVGLGIGFCVLLNLIYGKSKKQIFALVSTVCLCILLVVASPVISQGRDNTVFDDSLLDVPPHKFDDDDLALFETLSLSISYGSDIYMDHSSSRYYSENSGMGSYNLPYYGRPIGMNTLFTEHMESVDIPYIVFRYSLYLDNHLSVVFARGDGNAGRILYNEDEFMNFKYNTYEYNIFYENGKSTMYAHL